MLENIYFYLSEVPTYPDCPPLFQRGQISGLYLGKKTLNLLESGK